MKVAITADIHLSTDQEYPERFNALTNILDQLVKEKINNLIIAGDLFDAKSQNYSIFDDLCKKEQYNKIIFHIIPGNHDPVISKKYFSADNVKIYNQPSFLSFKDCAFRFFFVPYIPGRSMGEVIAKQKENIPERWVLIGHGDYISGIREPNTYEKGIYMPLGRSDIEYYNPSTVILGHIHKKMQIGRVYYPGSPCGMDINETGRRTYFVLDLNDLSILEREVNTDYIFFNEDIVVYPTSDEFEDIENKIKKMIDGWDLGKEEIEKARIRLRVRGYTSDKNRLYNLLKESLRDFSFYNGEEPDIGEVSLFNDPERASIVERVERKIDQAQKEGNLPDLKKEMILEKALAIILKE